MKALDMSAVITDTEENNSKKTHDNNRNRGMYRLLMWALERGGVQERPLAGCVLARTHCARRAGEDDHCTKRQCFFFFFFKRGISSVCS
jgi:hypothetical protein